MSDKYKLIDELYKMIELSYDRETCYPVLKEKWNNSNKALGHCAIVALIVNDFLGGKIMRCMCETGSHYYNLINSEIVDFTASQFKETPDYCLSEERTREYLLQNDDTKKRYKILLEKVKNNFINYGNKEYSLLTENGVIPSKIPGTVGGNKKLKIYGKLDCYNALNWISKGYYIDNRVFFENAEIAERLGYRPCAKCMKKEYIKWKNK